MTNQYLRRRFRARCICWTLNNPSPEEREKFGQFATDLPPEISYTIFQEEVGTVSGTTHFQGYTEFKKQKRFEAIKRILSDRCHLERRRGKQSEAIAYCQKKDSQLPNGLSVENGTPKKSVKDKIENVIIELNNGGKPSDIRDEFPKQYLMNKKKILEFYIEGLGQRHLEPNNNLVHIYYGPSGYGKTTSAWRDYPYAFKGCWPTGGRWWWPNYKGQEVVIFDEFRENITYQDCLALFDIHPMGIENKGGNTQNVSKKIIITTIRNPKHWYGKVSDKSELQRRIREHATIYEFTGDTVPALPKTEDAFPRTPWNMENFEFERKDDDTGEHAYDFNIYGTRNN